MRKRNVRSGKIFAILFVFLGLSMSQGWAEIRIALVKNQDIWITDEFGHSPVNITNSPSFRKLCPRFSPDGEKIAFYSDMTGRLELWTISVDGTDLKPLTNFTTAFPAYGDGGPAWSPDGQWIYFGSAPPGDGELFKIKIDGSSLTDLTRSRAGNTQSFDISPNGLLSVYALGTEGNGYSNKLFLDNADLTNPQLILADFAPHEPKFSPIGDKIAFYDVSANIHLINLDGTGDATIAQGLWIRAWDPSGQRLLVTDWNCLYWLSVDGTSLTYVSDGSYGTVADVKNKDILTAHDLEGDWIYSGGGLDGYIVRISPINDNEFTGHYTNYPPDTKEIFTGTITGMDVEINMKSSNSGYTCTEELTYVPGSLPRMEGYLTDYTGKWFIKWTRVNNLPPIAKCIDIEIAANAQCQAFISAKDVDNGSSDPDDDPLTYSLDFAGPFLLGETRNVIMSVEDGKGGKDSCVAKVTVIDKTPPVPDLAVLPTLSGECGVDSTTAPTAWDDCSGRIVGITSDPVHYSVQGTYTITWTYDDRHGNIAIQMQTVIVKDTLPPVMSQISASPNEFWPPNHKLMPVAISVAATDNCTALPQSEIVKVTCNEPVNGPGDGNTDPDWVLTGKLSLNVRSERSGTGNGRVYTITVACTDAAGNSALKDVTVTVPKSKGK
jgi:hypothetical protein